MNLNQSYRWGRMRIAGAVAVALVGGHLLTLPDAVAIPQTASPADVGWQHGPSSFSELVQQVKPAVVNISTTGRSDAGPGIGRRQPQMPEFPQGSPFDEYFRHFFKGNPGLRGGGQAEREFRAVGSGFIISADGYVVTNNHVIEHADEIEVITHDGTRYPAAVKGRDPKTDLALLEVETDEPLPYVEFGNSDDAEVGDWVVAVGNPFGLGGTVTAGIISARGRDIQSGPFDDFLQIDAPINRGNSGGPLFDTRGRVIGINTAIYSPSGGNVGIGFAIPSTMARDIIAELETQGSVARGWLGVQIQPVTKEVAESLGLTEQQGALVVSVVPDSPADRAGLQPGDVIVRMNGEALDDFKDLPKLVARAEAGRDSTLDVQRRGKLRQLEVEIGRMSGDEVEVALADSDKAAEPNRLGLYLAELTPEARQRYSISEQSDGVLVVGVERGSPAAKAGIRTGSLINMVGQEPVQAPDEVVAKVEEAAEQERASVLLLVEHRGDKRFVAVKFAAA